MTSPEHSAENEPNVTPQSRQGRKKMRRDRSKAYRKIAQLDKSIKEKERVVAFFYLFLFLLNIFLLVCFFLTPQLALTVRQHVYLFH
jgi:hypothetical protein